MSNVSEWSVSAGLNNSSPPDGWPEGMARSAVNDTAREMMAALAKWYQDSNGTLVAAGGTLAYTLTTNSVYTAVTDIPLLVFRMNAANTGTVTLNVDGLGAKPWRKDASNTNYLTGELAINQLVVVAYNSVEDDFYTVGPVADSAVPATTAMVFYQASVPTGWTAVAQNNKALRVVTSGTTGGTAGGTTAFTSVFTSRTIAKVNLPAYDLSHNLDAASHSHSSGTLAGVTDTESSHSHDQTEYLTLLQNVATTGGADNIWQGTSDDGVSSAGSHAHAVDVNSGSTGSSAPAVSGTVSLGGSGTAMDFAVQYVDVCIGTKN